MDTKKNNIANSNINIMPEEKKSKLIIFLIAIFISFAITIIIFISYAMLITYTDLSEKNIVLIANSTNIISVMIAGFDIARSSKNKGWFWGILAGLVYAIILSLIGFALNNKIMISSQTLMLFLLSASSGAVGGIIGINFKK